MSVQVIGCLSATVLYLCFFLRLRSCSFGTVWKGCERIVFGLPELGMAFGLFGSVASSFGTMWKGCERTVFGCLFSGLCFACLGHEACCRSRLSEASHRGILLGVPAAVRAFRMGSFTAPWHVCGRFGLGTTFGSSTAFGVAVYWFRTQPRSEGAGHKKCFMDSKGDGKHFFWLVFLACLSSACSGVWPFRIRCPRASFLCLCRL